MKHKFVVSSLLTLSLGSLLVACNRLPSGAIQPAQISNESFQVSGDYEMHYNALRTDQLTTDIAQAYGIERSQNKVLLNISVLHKTAGATQPNDADITVVAHNPNGQIKDVQLRRVAETAATYYIGEVSFSGAETLVFEIKAVPAGSGIPITATLTREFFAN